MFRYRRPSVTASGDSSVSDAVDVQRGRETAPSRWLSLSFCLVISGNARSCVLAAARGYNHRRDGWDPRSRMTARYCGSTVSGKIKRRSETEWRSQWRIQKLFRGRGCRFSSTRSNGDAENENVGRKKSAFEFELAIRCR